MRINSFLKKVDNRHLELLGIAVIAIIMFPIVYLICRDGNGSAIFQVHDQLDETILSYVFAARYGNVALYEQMMCGVPSEGLKASSVIFVPLYKLFSVYSAFEIQYFIVITSAFFSMYFCVKRITGSSVSALIAATMFSFLPVHSIYGNALLGTPIILAAMMKYEEPLLKSKITGVLAIIYFGLSANIALSGWAALGFVFLYCVYKALKDKKLSFNRLFPFISLFVTYIFTNLDLIAQVFSDDSFVSHRIEMLSEKDSGIFRGRFWGLLTNGTCEYEANSMHEWIIIPLIAAILFLALCEQARKLLKPFIVTGIFILFFAFFSSLFSTKLFDDIQNCMPGMFSSFQFNRLYYFLPGCYYLLLGICSAIIINGISRWNYAVAYVVLAGLNVPLVLSIVKDHDGIFYQNINQINNGQSVTGYITMKRLYAEDLMQEIEDAIGKEMSTYRIVNIGISPVASLMHGFHTIDGYSNNYPLEYKHKFREIIEGELAENDYIKAYFDNWGSRCYAFYHEWGSAYMLGDGFNGTIDDLRMDISKMKDMNCQYIFSVGEITDCGRYGLISLGEFSNEDSYWNIWVYELQ